MKKVINIILGLLLFSTCFAQDEVMVKELTKLREVYQEKTAFSVDIQYNLYLGSSSKPEESFTAHLTKQSNQYKLTSKEQTSVVNEQHALTINHNEKMVLYQAANPSNTSNEIDPSTFDVASLLKLAHETDEIKGLNKGNKGYRFKFYAAQYEYIDVVYNVSNYHIEKIELKVRVPKDQEAQRLEIRYSNMNTSPTITSSTFSTRKYIITKNQEARLTAAYKDYKLIN